MFVCFLLLVDQFQVKVSNLQKYETAYTVRLRNMVPNKNHLGSAIIMKIMIIIFI